LLSNTIAEHVGCDPTNPGALSWVAQRRSSVANYFLADFSHLAEFGRDMARPARRLQFRSKRKSQRSIATSPTTGVPAMKNFISNAASTRRCILMLTAIAAGLAAGCANADADRTDDVPRIVVSLAGIDMSTSTGASVVYGRIRSAAQAVCRVNQSRDLKQIALARDCYRNAVDDAVAQANRPMLSELHARKMGDAREVIRSASR
jgi:UrcA family protein